MTLKKLQALTWLFGINLFISTFTFGGGYVVVPMIRKYFVLGKKLFSEEELMDMAAVAQSTPGAIAVNLSALAGYRTAGTAGAILSSVAAVIPPLVILTIISGYYAAFSANTAVAAVLKGMQAGVAALIADLVIDMTNMIAKNHSPFFTFLIPTAFVTDFFFQINTALILAVCCLICIARVFLSGKWRKSL